MSNKLRSGVCLFPDCEQVLIHPYNDFQMCSIHTEWMHKQQYEFRQRHNRARNAKKGGNQVVSIHNVLNQIKPIGQPTEKIVG